MKTKFDELISRHADKNKLENVRAGFTESVIREVLVYQRKKKAEPLIPVQLLWSLIIGLSAAVIFTFWFADNGVAVSGNFSRAFNFEFPIDFSKILSIFSNLSILYFVIAAFLLIDLFARKLIGKSNFK